MKYIRYIFLSLSMGILALLFFAYQKELILINCGISILSSPSSPKQASKKNVTLWYWHHEAWHHENESFLYFSNQPLFLQQIITRLLELMHEEKISSKKTAVSSLLINTSDNTVFVSFDHIPWNKEWCIFEKWMLLESILKTLRNVDSSIKKVHFLINHQPLIDPHLDCTNAWPIEGFR